MSNKIINGDAMDSKGPESRIQIENNWMTDG